MKVFIRTFANAWNGVVSHKLRSFLTILGIVIGVAAVITLMSIGKGTEATILSRIQSLGSDLLFVNPGSIMGTGRVRGAMGSATSLTMQDAEAIAAKVKDITSVTPISTTNLQLIAGNNNTNSQVTGTTPDYMTAYNINVARGTFFSEYSYQSAARVAVLGSTVAETLYGNNDPLGQELRMGTMIVRIIGVCESKGTVTGSPDNLVFIPLTTMQQSLSQQRTVKGEQIVSSIVLKIIDMKKIDQIKTDITSLLRSRHKLASTAENDFSITSMEEVATTVSETMSTMTIFLGAIAGISLLVGGIGVMNIMLVSVLERTREIGIRKALGAQEKDIWLQFLLESSLLSLIGGIIGIILGWAMTFLISSMASLTTAVTADIIILAVSVSAGIGITFGFYPAWQASMLNPIDALRHQ